MEGRKTEGQVDEEEQRRRAELELLIDDSRKKEK